jgi:hypothetical protein
MKGRNWRRPSNIIIAILLALLLAFVAQVPRHLHCVQPQERPPNPRLQQLPIKHQAVLHYAYAAPFTAQNARVA